MFFCPTEKTQRNAFLLEDYGVPTEKNTCNQVSDHEALSEQAAGGTYLSALSTSGNGSSGQSTSEQEIANPDMPPSTDLTPEEINAIIGRNLRKTRILRNLSQQKLGRMVGITFQQIQKYERGTNRIVSDRIVALSVALEVPFTTFFDGILFETDNNISLTDHEIDFIRIMRELKPQEREHIKLLARAISRSDHDDGETASGVSR